MCKCTLRYIKISNGKIFENVKISMKFSRRKNFTKFYISSFMAR